MLKQSLFIACLLTSAVTGTASAAMKHTTTEKDTDGNAQSVTEFVAVGDGNLKISYKESTGATGGTMYFIAADEKMVMIDGPSCQEIGADSPPPPGMPAGGLDQYQEQMRQAQAEMDKAFAEMAKQNPQMAEALKEQFGASAIRPPDELKIVETGDTRTVGGYRTTGFDVVNAETNARRFTVYAADIDDVEGGEEIAEGLRGMFGVYKAYMEKMGVGKLAGTELTGAIMSKMEDYYPILTINHEDNTQSVLTATDEVDDVELVAGCD